jgi:hypothetical protein
MTLLTWAASFFWIIQIVPLGCSSWILSYSPEPLASQPLEATTYVGRSLRPLTNFKSRFIGSLNRLDGLNEYTSDRSQLLETLIAKKIDVPVDQLGSTPESEDRSIAAPGKWENMQPVAAGDWKVVYAPHMTTMAKLAGGGEFRVSYLLNKDGTMTSHARCDFPFLRSLLGQSCIYLSVSGTYGSQSEYVCRVDFDEAWIKAIRISDGDVEDAPYSKIEEVPDSLWKTVIRRLGRLFFVKDVSIFPISYMDEDMIVFDFELLGTRIVSIKRLIE